jgi:hypothetical protein
VVAPDDDILHIRYLDIESLRDLTKGPVVVKPCQAGDVLLWDGWGKLLQDQGIGVCRVSHNQDLFTRKKISLFGEIITIISEQYNYLSRIKLMAQT